MHKWWSFFPFTFYPGDGSDVSVTFSPLIDRRTINLQTHKVRPWWKLWLYRIKGGWQ